MSEFSQDDLNAFFKGKLENADPDGTMWNVPPDFVFDNAINKVNAQQPQPKASNRKLLLLLLIPIALLSGLIINSQLNLNKISNEVKSLESKLINSNSQIAQLEDELTLQKNDFANQLKTQTEEIKATIKTEARTLFESQNKKSKKIKQNASSQISTNKYNVVSKQTLINNSKNSSNGKGGIANKNTDQNLNTNSNFSIITNDNQSSFLKNVVSIPTLDLATTLFHESRDVKFDLPKLVSVNDINEELGFDGRGIVYGISTRQNFSSLIMTGNNSELSSYDNSYTGFGFSLQAQKSISPKVDMVFSLGYDLINSRSEMSNLALYDRTNENEGLNGGITYEMDVDIETPFGAVNSFTNFDVQENANADLDEMDQLTKTAQSLNVLSLNIGPKYKWLSNRQWELFTTASIGYNRILHYENEMNTSIKMNNKTMVEFRATPPKINDINKNFLSAQVGLGLGFKFSENIQLAMSANYGRSLNSLRVARSSTDPLTHLSQWNSQIGMNFSF